MKAFLMHKGRSFDAGRPLPWNEKHLTQDLELATLFSAMARGDGFLLDVARKAVLASVHNSPEDILYRQGVLKDCLRNPEAVRSIYGIVVEAIECEKKIYWGFFSWYPSAILDRSVEVLQMYAKELKRLRDIADRCSGQFASEGFVALFETLMRELSDEYLAAIEEHLKALRFRDGVLASAELGRGNKGTNYVLRRPYAIKQGWLERVFGRKAPVYSYTIAERDEAGARALSELRDRCINQAANALARSCDHIHGFFSMLRMELAFYIGCLNLYERLALLGEPACFPVPAGVEERRHSFKGLYDVCLALARDERVVGNDLSADGRALIVITGANQGGKSTFLRSIGLAQLMMQSGMFVAAEHFSANVCDGIFTHYRREEDATMSHGKLEEELGRMSDIVDHITPNPLLLFNESFAATNEREGSEIAGQIMAALMEARVKAFFVTHMYGFARSLYEKNAGDMIFLRAERKNDGERTYRLIEGEPLQTSYGKDLYVKMTPDDVSKKNK